MGYELVAWIGAGAVLLIANVVSAVLVIADKRNAELGEWRVPESTLAGWALLGGFPAGILAMRKVRHKTKKRSFQLKYGLAVVAHLLVWAAGLRLFLPI